MNINTITSKGELFAICSNQKASIDFRLYKILESTGFYWKNKELTNKKKPKYYGLLYKNGFFKGIQKINANKGKAWKQWRNNFRSETVKNGGEFRIINNELYSEFLAI